jgi:hypothetical protein
MLRGQAFVSVTINGALLKIAEFAAKPGTVIACDEPRTGSGGMDPEGKDT